MRGMSIATAIFFPPRANMADAIREAACNRPARSTLCTDGYRLEAQD